MQSLISALQEQKNLIGGSLVSDTLNDILIGLCDLVRQQQDDIKKIQNTLENVMTRDEIETNLKQNQNHQEARDEQINQKFNEIISEYNNIKKEVIINKKKIEHNSKQTENIINDLKVSLNEEYGNRMFLMNETMNTLSSRFSTLNSQFATLDKDFSILKETFEQIRVNKIRSLSEHLKQIDDLADTHSNKLHEISEIVKQNEAESTERFQDIKIENEKEVCAIRSDMDEIQSQLFISGDNGINTNSNFNSNFNNNSSNSSNNNNNIENNSSNNNVNNQNDNIGDVQGNSSNNRVSFSQKNSLTNFPRQRIMNNASGNNNSQNNKCETLSDAVFDSVIMPIVRANHRNTRRIDGMNEQVSNVRIECENISGAVQQSQATLERFHHAIYDNAKDIEDTRNEFKQNLNSVLSFLEILSNNIIDNWDLLLAIAKEHQHLSTSTSNANDIISNIFTSLSTKPVPNINTFDHVAIESQENVECVSSKIISMSLPKHLQNLKNSITKTNENQLRKTAPERVEEYRTKLKQIVPSAIVRNANKILGSSQPVNTGNNDPMIMSTLEENRSKMQKINNTLELFMKESIYKMNDIIEKLNKKMDSKSADRVFAKIQQTISKIQRNVDIVSENQFTSMGNTQLYFDESLPSLPQTPDTPSLQMNITSRPKSRAPVLKDQLKEMGIGQKVRRPKTSFATPSHSKTNSPPNERHSMPRPRTNPKSKQMKLASSNVVTPRNL
ncbi:hypothetical protein TRFO_38513 [Tritrichomonas foetus]|uniref:Uncharacterized protein n=1 Tax=Tritrichomonas foetus TaxID=1144522 RepID=A0A1J4JCI5_9EUKA|nr:hypothetical protein TRFO_38513 [Tritrichomonas foetus]|eukprot:OHS95371.1 hypothetical protein TRFO_38513 [Tritrichomonas foetus]